MRDHEISTPTVPEHKPWNKGKLIGAKPPLRPKHVWSIRTTFDVDRQGGNHHHSHRFQQRRRPGQTGLRH